MKLSTQFAQSLPRLEVFAELTSTNQYLMAELGADFRSWPDGALVVADFQSAGVGRSGAQWGNVPGGNINMSIVVDVPANLETGVSWLPLLVGLAVQRALCQLVPGLGMKWPNDPTVDLGSEAPNLPGWGTRRKVGGILVQVALGPEASPSFGGGDIAAGAGSSGAGSGGGHGPVMGRKAIVGIGLNVAGAPADVPWAISLRDALKHGRNPEAQRETLPAVDLERGPMIESIYRQWQSVWQTWQAANFDVQASGLKVEVSRICHTIGQNVQVRLANGKRLRGRVEALAPDGALQLRDERGQQHIVHAGEVSSTRQKEDR